MKREKIEKHLTSNFDSVSYYGAKKISERI